MSKRRKKRTRPLSSFTRSQGNRQPRQCILIVCEGAETEPNYFRSLRAEWKLGPVEVEIVKGDTCGSAPSSVVKYAVKQKHQRDQDVNRGTTGRLPFDEVWCVFDQENPPDNLSFHQAVHEASDKGLGLAVSTPAFEYWYLLHFTETDRPFHNADEVIGDLKNHIPEYQKGLNVFDTLVSHTQSAIDRARRLWANRPDPSEEFPNSSTLVFRLVKKLQDMSNWRK